MRRSTIIMIKFGWGRVPFAANFMPPAWVEDALATIERVLGEAVDVPEREVDLRDVEGFCAMSLQGMLRGLGA